MKLCGYKESCFKNGSEFWDRYGDIICHHYGETGETIDELDNNCICICTLTNEKVQTYSNESDYDECTIILRQKKLDSL
ncbi:hypothetical protein M0Q50_05410 [bacterium]|jgi:hypothetical protein|nr:hypothetical protein [bacterium]